MRGMTTDIVWQAIPTRELIRLAETLEEVAATTRPVLATGLQQTIEAQANMLRYHIEQAEGYNAAAAEWAKAMGNLASL